MIAIDQRIAWQLRRWGLRLGRHAGLDLPLLAMLLLLCGLGLAVLYSATGGNLDLVMRQAVRLGVGFVALLVLARTSPASLRRVSPAVFVLSLGLLVAVAIAGEGRGAARWLDLGLFRFQPSELAKLGLPMMLAWYLHARELPPRWTDLVVCGLLIGLPTLLIARQPDLGTALLVASAGGFVLFLAGLQWRRILLLGGLALASLPLLWAQMHDYQRNRVLTLLDPESDPLGRGWNIIQSKIAVGSGGIWGKGWMGGTQSRLEFLPERSTDFIFAVFAEEFGLVGVGLLLVLYLAIILRALWMASEARETYGRLLGGAIALAFFVYVAVNGGMISGVLPVVGVPMPMISYGGTSAMSLLVGFGILMAIHADRRRP